MNALPRDRLEVNAWANICSFVVLWKCVISGLCAKYAYLTTFGETMLSWNVIANVAGRWARQKGPTWRIFIMLPSSKRPLLKSSTQLSASSTRPFEVSITFKSWTMSFFFFNAAFWRGFTRTGEIHAHTKLIHCQRRSEKRQQLPHAQRRWVHASKIYHRRPLMQLDKKDLWTQRLTPGRAPGRDLNEYILGSSSQRV